MNKESILFKESRAQSNAMHSRKNKKSVEHSDIFDKFKNNANFISITVIIYGQWTIDFKKLLSANLK